MSQAQCRVGSASDDVGIVIILAVILPKANLADFVPASLFERFAAATRASQWQVGEVRIHCSRLFEQSRMPQDVRDSSIVFQMKWIGGPIRSVPYPLGLLICRDLRRASGCVVEWCPCIISQVRMLWITHDPAKVSLEFQSRFEHSYQQRSGAVKIAFTIQPAFLPRSRAA